MIRVQTEDVDIGALIKAAKEPGTGAVVVFDGVVRDDGITEMELEAYADVAVADDLPVVVKLERPAEGVPVYAMADSDENDYSSDIPCRHGLPERKRLALVQ